MFFAALPPPGSAESIGWLVLAIAALLASLNQSHAWIKRMRGEPPNEELKGGADVIAQRVASLEAEAKEAMTRRRLMHEKIDTVEKRVRDDVKEEFSGVYVEVNKLREACAALQATVTLLNQTVAQLDARLHQPRPR